MQPRLDRLATVPQALLPAAELKQEIERHKAEPLRYAVGHALALDQRNGAWDESSPGVSRWRLRVSSEGARSLSLRLEDLSLPEGAQLWLSGADGVDVQGPFDRRSSAVRDGVLWLPVVRAAEAVLEVRLPTAAAPDLKLRIAEAFHGFRPFEASSVRSDPKAAIGDDSGSCNINVVCSQGDAWRNEIRSTVLLSTAGVSLCTGTLMNNTSRNDRPLILTANHCGIRTTNVTAVTAYFNVQSTTCSGNQDGRVDQNLAGATFLARDSNSDFTLFALASTPPTAFNVYYAGWNARTDLTPQSGVAIHHPQGDEKKISVYSTAATSVEDVRIGGSGSSGFDVDAWQIRWAQGTTEGGSSGSALWNQSHQVVGMLSGGGASCSTTTDPDFFARFARAWQATCDTGAQLRAHLDPGNTGCLELASKNPGASSPIANCAAAGSAGTASSNGQSCAAGGDSGGGGGSPGPLLLAGLAALAISRRAFRAAAAA